MSSEQKRYLVLALDALIREQKEGSAIELSEYLAVSRSTVYRLLDYMRKELNAPVKFSVKENRYTYAEDGVIFFGFIPLKFLSEELHRYIQDLANKKVK